MKIFICCSSSFYGYVNKVRETLEMMGHEVTVPVGYGEASPQTIEELGGERYREWVAESLKEQAKKVEANDAILVLNLKKGDRENYIGGAVFLEIYKAWELGKKIFLFNPIPENSFTDELLGMRPQVIWGVLNMVK